MLFEKKKNKVIGYSFLSSTCVWSCIIVDLVLLYNLITSISCQIQNPPPRIGPTIQSIGNGRNQITASQIAIRVTKIITPLFLYPR